MLEQLYSEITANHINITYGFYWRLQHPVNEVWSADLKILFEFSKSLNNSVKEKERSCDRNCKPILAEQEMF